MLSLNSNSRSTNSLPAQRQITPIAFAIESGHVYGDRHTGHRRLEFERRQYVTLGDVMTWIVSREDLILSKLVWARESQSELQRRDVRQLLAGNVDIDYLNRWANTLGVDAILEELLP